MITDAGDNPTITAMSTPPGAGGIGIIRVSGSDSLQILKKIFKPAQPSCSFASHRFYYGTITDPQQEKLLDEARTTPEPPRLVSLAQVLQELLALVRYQAPPQVTGLRGANAAPL